MSKNVTLFDLADALQLSTATVHRALYDHSSVRPATKARVRQMAKSLGYRPNLAARYLKSKRSFRVSVNTLQGTTSFWDEVRAGIAEEARSLPVQNVELMWLIISLINCAVYAVAGAAFVGLHKKRGGAATT